TAALSLLSDPISGTDDDALYQTERLGNSNGQLYFALNVPNGNYRVTLLFAEIFWDNPGQRVFDVVIEGATVLDDFDIVAAVGKFTATTRIFDTAVGDGTLNIDFLGSTDRPFAVERVTRELIANEDYVAGLSPLEDSAGKTVVITPLQPLKAKTGYMVVLTNGIRALLDGSPAVPDRTYIFARYRGNHHRPLVDENNNSNFPQLTDAQARALVPIQTAVLSQEEAAASQGIDRGSIVLSWTFMTQSIDDVLQVVRSGVTAQPLGVVATGSDTSTLGLAGLADIYAGTMQIPYYLQAPVAPQDAPIILSTRWRGVNDSAVTRYNPQPIAPQSVTIPVLATVPNDNSGQSKPPRRLAGGDFPARHYPESDQCIRSGRYPGQSGVCCYSN
ncbi:MAG: hypothetical protein HC808_04605, partial [Candidatus Competibacteraceae bacterium]|nr:hypothetical protein [Candidatus Competibacteraceae bacterium]